MIRGLHAMWYSSDAEGLRAFFRDKLRLPHADVGEGWLLFDLPEVEVGCHPADAGQGAASGTPYLSLWCDDLAATMAELKDRGVEFVGDVEERGWGRVARFRVPGGFEIELYEPSYDKGGG